MESTISVDNTSLPQAGGYNMVAPILLPVRELWKDEAKQFTPWLARKNSLSLLGDALGLDIKNAPSQESTVPDSKRRCDIEVAVDGNDGDETMIIENQLEETDFSHLGRIMLYAAQRNAKHIVWVTPEVDSDHRCVISWLNRNTNASVYFYLVQLNVFKTGVNAAMPIFTVVERPNIDSKVATSGSPTQKFNLALWSGFREFVDLPDNRKRLASLPSFASPWQNNWFDIRFGKAGCFFRLAYSRQKNEASIKLFAATTPLLDLFKTAIGNNPGNPSDSNDSYIFIDSKKMPSRTEQERKSLFGWFVSKLEKLAPLVQNSLNSQA